jgi:hypothetical protein
VRPSAYQLDLGVQLFDVNNGWGWLSIEFPPNLIISRANLQAVGNRPVDSFSLDMLLLLT